VYAKKLTGCQFSPEEKVKKNNEKLKSIIYEVSPREPTVYGRNYCSRPEFEVRTAENWKSEELMDVEKE